MTGMSQLLISSRGFILKVRGTVTCGPRWTRVRLGGTGVCVMHSGRALLLPVLYLLRQVALQAGTDHVRHRVFTHHAMGGGSRGTKSTFHILDVMGCQWWDED